MAYIHYFSDNYNNKDTMYYSNIARASELLPARGVGL